MRKFRQRVLSAAIILPSKGILAAVIRHWRGVGFCLDISK